MPTVRSNRVVLDEVRPATIRYEGGVVVDIGEGLADEDFGDHVLLPGLVDSHVHVNEPGRTEWEGFESATRAALAGGTTTIVDMPLNSVPPTIDVESLEEKRASAAGQIACDVAFWGGVVPGSESQVGALEEQGVCGFKVFMVDSGVPEFEPVADPAAIEMSTPLLVHAEDPAFLTDPVDGSYQAYLDSRPPSAEASAIERLAGLDAHVLHVSSAEGADAISRVGLSGETCPHYLTFVDSDVSGPAYKCAPPIRDGSHREALWEALSQGVLSMVVSDHSPSPPDLKTDDFSKSWGGISSVQLRLLATWTGAFERGFGWVALRDWLALNPSRLAGLDDRKGSIAVGKDADFVVFDTDGATDVKAKDLHHRHPITPYDGMRLRGSVVDVRLGSPARMLRRK